MIEGKSGGLNGVSKIIFDKLKGLNNLIFRIKDMAIDDTSFSYEPCEKGKYEQYYPYYNAQDVRAFGDYQKRSPIVMKLVNRPLKNHQSIFYHHCYRNR